MFQDTSQFAGRKHRIHQDGNHTELDRRQERRRELYAVAHLDQGEITLLQSQPDQAGGDGVDLTL